MTRRSPLTREERVVLASLALVVVFLVFRLWVVAGSWFYSDDFIFLGDVATGDARGGWYLEPHNVHVMPFSRWLITLVGSAGTFAWWAAATQILALHTAAAVTCWWMLRTLFGDRPGILLPLGVYLFSPATVTTTVWWAAAINQIPHQIALMGAVAAHVRFLRHRRGGDVLLTTAFLTLGFASYTKSVLIPVLLAVLTVCYFAAGPLVTRLREAVGRYGLAWSVLGATTAVYLWVYLSVAPSSPVPTWDVVRGTIDLSVVQAAIPSLVGGPWSWQELGQPGGVGPRLFVDVPLAGVVLAWLVVVGLTLYQGLQHRRAWWPLAIVVGYAVAGAAIIGIGRATAFGPEAAALELRYQADLVAVAALGLGLATMPLVGARQSLERRDPPLLTSPPRRRIVVVPIALALVSGLITSVLYVAPWHDRDTMPQIAFVETARAATAGTQRDVLESGVPDEVLWSAAFPKNLVSRVLSPLGRDLRIVDQGVDLNVVRPDGSIGPATISGDPRNIPGPVKECGYLVEALETVDIPVEPVIDFPFMASLGVLAAGDVEVAVTAGTVERRIDVPRGPHTVFLPSAGAFNEVKVTNNGFRPLCVDAVRIGAVVPLEVLP